MNAIEVIKQIAEEEINKIQIMDMGIVTSVSSHRNKEDKENYDCDVRLKNRDLELKKVPVATQVIGLACAPKVGELVLLAFIRGNINAPVVIARLYNDEDRPPINNPGEIIFESPDQGNADMRRVYAKLPSGMILTIRDDNVNIEAGQSIISINLDGDITILSKAKVLIKSEGDISLSGQSIKIEGSKSVEMTSGGSAKLEASGNFDIKGNIVNIN